MTGFLIINFVGLPGIEPGLHLCLSVSRHPKSRTKILNPNNSRSTRNRTGATPTPRVRTTTIRYPDKFGAGERCIFILWNR